MIGTSIPVTREGDDWGVYYDRGRRPRKAITRYEATRSEGLHYDVSGLGLEAAEESCAFEED